MPLRLHVVVGSTRPGRVGPATARWFCDFAREESPFDVRLIDLRDVNLPHYDEPKHPRLNQYAHEHTRQWSASVAAADAFVFVTPEYNYGTSPALLNALNFVYNEWSYKAAAFVSYGGVSGGLRAVEMTKQTLTTLKVVPLVEAVTVPYVTRHIFDGAFEPKDSHIEGASGLLRELHRFVVSLRERQKVEMLFAHLKRILKLDRPRLRGPNGARDEFLLAATAQNFPKLAKLAPNPG